jgi:hypothetical protein
MFGLRRAPPQPRRLTGNPERGSIIAFQYVHWEAAGGQQARSRHPGQPGPNDDNWRSVGIPAPPCYEIGHDDSPIRRSLP